MRFIGVDIGASKIAAAASENVPEISAWRVEATPRNTDGEELVRSLRSLVQRVVEDSGGDRCEALGVACPGPIDFVRDTVSPVNMPNVVEFPLKQRLESVLGYRVVIENDANAFALAEARHGAGQGFCCVLGVVMSSGIGGGIVHNGRLFRGASGNAGHIGHTLVDVGGPRCSCGTSGCLTAVASGLGIAKLVEQQIREGSDTLLRDRNEEGLTGEDVVRAASGGDPVSLAVITRAAVSMGRALASAAHLLDPDLIVVGGGLVTGGALLWNALVNEYRARTCLQYARTARLVRAALGPRAGVIGALTLVDERRR